VGEGKNERPASVVLKFLLIRRSQTRDAQRSTPRWHYARFTSISQPQLNTFFSKGACGPLRRHGEEDWTSMVCRGGYPAICYTV
jgi:hypothetical protein